MECNETIKEAVICQEIFTMVLSDLNDTIAGQKIATILTESVENCATQRAMVQRAILQGPQWFPQGPSTPLNHPIGLLGPLSPGMMEISSWNEFTGTNAYTFLSACLQLFEILEEFRQRTIINLKDGFLWRGGCLDEATMREIQVLEEDVLSMEALLASLTSSSREELAKIEIGCNTRLEDMHNLCNQIPKSLEYAIDIVTEVSIGLINATKPLGNLGSLLENRAFAFTLGFLGENA